MDARTNVVFITDHCEIIMHEIQKNGFLKGLGLYVGCDFKNFEKNRRKEIEDMLF